MVVHNAVPPGAPPDEADVLVQAAAVRAALAGLGHSVTQFACDLDLASLQTALRAQAPQVVFNLVESLGGQGRLIHLVPEALEALGARYTGCPAEAVYLTSHKVLTKALLRAAGLPTAAWIAEGAHGGPAEDADRWIIKSVWEDASLGLDDRAIVTGDRQEIIEQLVERSASPGAPWFAEAFIEGREFNIALLDGPAGPQVLPHAEMLFRDYPAGKPRIVGYAAKWHPDSFEYSHTVRTFDFPPADGPLLEELTELSLACWRLFGLRGWARVDFRVDGAGRPWILEVNANPCLAPDAGFAAALQQARLTFEQAVERILAAAG